MQTGDIDNIITFVKLKFYNTALTGNVNVITTLLLVK